MAWTIPAQAVPCPTRSPVRGRRRRDGDRRRLDAKAADEPPADRRVIGLHARIDDRDSDARAVGVTERRLAIHRAERADTLKAKVAPVANASLQAGRDRSVTAASDPACDPPRHVVGSRQEHVQPGDGKLDVVWVGVAEAGDPIGQLPDWIVRVQALDDVRDEGLDCVASRPTPSAWAIDARTARAGPVPRDRAWSHGQRRSRRPPSASRARYRSGRTASRRVDRATPGRRSSRPRRRAARPATCAGHSRSVRPSRARSAGRPRHRRPRAAARSRRRSRRCPRGRDANPMTPRPAGPRRREDERSVAGRAGRRAAVTPMRSAAASATREARVRRRRHEPVSRREPGRHATRASSARSRGARSIPAVIGHRFAAPQGDGDRG